MQNTSTESACRNLFCYLSEVPIHATFTLVNVAWYLRYSAADIIVVSLVPQLLHANSEIS